MHRLIFVLGVIVGVLLTMAFCKRKAHPAQPSESEYWEKRLDSLNSFYDEEQRSERLRK